MQLEQVYREHLGFVLQSLRRLGVSPGRVEDLAHDVFLTVHRKRGDFDPARPLRPWLFGIANALASNERQRAHVFREEPGERDAIDQGLSPEDHSEQGAARRVVAKALDALDADKRAIFILHELDQVPVSTAADSLGVAVDTAWSRLRAARKQFNEAALGLLGSAEGGPRG